MTMENDREYVACPLCAASEGAFWAEEAGWTAIQCSDCGTVYLNPRPKLDSISESSKSGMHRVVDGVQKRTGRFQTAKIRDFKQRLGEALPADEAEGLKSWLDVGCGFGELLLAVRSMLPDCTLTCGVEPNERKRAVACGNGLDVHGSMQGITGSGFDAISMINVFSHLPDPRAEFDRIAGILNPGGLFLVATGNGPDIPVDLVPRPLGFPDHLVFFEIRHMERLLEECGFTVIGSNKYQSFFHVNETLRVLKNIVKSMLGQPKTQKNVGPYFDYLVVARKNGPANHQAQ
jgi:SAM-dependent methyltransferase